MPPSPVASIGSAASGFGFFLRASGGAASGGAASGGGASTPASTAKSPVGEGDAAPAASSVRDAWSCSNGRVTSSGSACTGGGGGATSMSTSSSASAQNSPTITCSTTDSVSARPTVELWMFGATILDETSVSAVASG